MEEIKKLETTIRLLNKNLTHFQCELAHLRNAVIHFRDGFLHDAEIALNKANDSQQRRLLESFHPL